MKGNDLDYKVTHKCDCCSRSSEYPYSEQWAASHPKDVEGSYRKVKITIRMEFCLEIPGEKPANWTIEVDLCPDCFHKMVLNHLKERGVLPRVINQSIL